MTVLCLVKNYSNVNFVTNPTRQKNLGRIISVPSIGRNKSLCKSVVFFDCWFTFFKFLFELFYSFSILTFIFFFSYFEWQAQMSLLWQLTRNQKCYAKPYQYLPWPAQMSILWRIIRYKTVIAISYQYQTSTGTKFYVSQWWFLTAILLIYFFLFEFELFYSISILTFIFFFSYFKWQVQMSILRQFTRM